MYIKKNLESDSMRLCTTNAVHAPPHDSLRSHEENFSIYAPPLRYRPKEAQCTSRKSCVLYCPSTTVVNSVQLRYPRNKPGGKKVLGHDFISFDMLGTGFQCQYRECLEASFMVAPIFPDTYASVEVELGSLTTRPAPLYLLLCTYHVHHRYPT